MSEMRTILEDTCAKLFARFEDPAVLRRVEETGDCSDVWAAVAEQGLDQIFGGGSDDPWRDACVVLKACGRHVLPAPLAETLMANALLEQVGLEPMAGPLAFAEASPSHPQKHCENVAWGRNARHAVTIADGEMTVWSIEKANVTAQLGVSREPRDTLAFAGAAAVQKVPFPSSEWESYWECYGALMRAAQLAGCIEAVLAMTVSYARERQQFGKPIGSFQAIQHQLAILAGHSAAASRIVDAAFDRIAEGARDIHFEAAVAKIRCGEAAGVAASIAHQTHGAIGFTDEHRLHYYTRRLWSWRSEFGSEAHWSAILGRRVAQAGADGFWPLVTAAG